MLVDDEGWVTGFARAGQADTSYHFVGPQVAAHAAFAGVKDGEYAESTWGCYLPLIAANPHGIRAFKVDGIQFLDIGTVADYVRTSETIAARRRVDRWTIGRNARIAPSATVTRSIVWDDVTIGEDAIVRRLRGDRRRHDSAPGARYSNSVDRYSVRMPTDFAFANRM